MRDLNIAVVRGYEEMIVGDNEYLVFNLNTLLAKFLFDVQVSSGSFDFEHEIIRERVSVPDDFECVDVFFNYNMDSDYSGVLDGYSLSVGDSSPSYEDSITIDGGLRSLADKKPQANGVLAKVKTNLKYGELCVSGVLLEDIVSYLGSQYGYGEFDSKAFSEDLGELVVEHASDHLESLSDGYPDSADSFESYCSEFTIDLGDVFFMLEGGLCNVQLSISPLLFKGLLNESQLELLNAVLKDCLDNAVSA